MKEKKTHFRLNKSKFNVNVMVKMDFPDQHCHLSLRSEQLCLSTDASTLRCQLSADACRLSDSVLRKVPSDRELSRLASRLGAEWEVVLMDLGLSAEAVFRCRSDNGLNTQAAVLAGLVQWRRSLGKKATVERMLQSLEAADVHPSVLEDALT